MTHLTQRGKNVLARLFQWSTFGVAMSLLPIFLAWLNKSYAMKGSDYPALADVVAHGELMLVAVAISSAAVGDLFFANNKFHTLKVLGLSSTFLCAAMAIGMFATVSSVASANPARVTTSSYWILGFVLGCSAGCVIITEAGRES